MKKLNKFLLAIFIVVATGCTSSRQLLVMPQPQTAEQVSVYVYRPAAMANVVVSPNVLIDGDKRFELKNDSYQLLYLTAGKHDIELELAERFDGNRNIQLVMEPGSVHYLKITTEMKFKKNDLYYRRFDIHSIPAEQALNEIRTCRYLGNTGKKEPVITSEQEADAEVSESEEAQYSISKSRDPFARNH